jgi:hypothetical protein
VKDGKRQEYQTDLSREEVLKLLASGNLDELLDHVGDKLPADEKEAMKEALRASSLAMKSGEQKPHSEAKAQEEIVAKLDKILDRLDRLENEIKALQAKDEKKPKRP